MSTAVSSPAAPAAHPAAHPEGHGRAHSQDHQPHVLPLKWYFGVFAALIVFTGITVAVSYVDLGEAVNLFIALAVATCKAAMVALVFMHLLWDSKFNAVVFVSSLIFLAIFIAFTMFDTETRGRLDRVEGDRPAVFSEPFDGATPAATGRRGTR